MIRISKAISVFILFCHISIAQWSEQSSGITTALYSVSAYDNSAAWVCGANGRVLRTTNGGVNWIITASPNATLPLYNICAVNDSTALVTGTSTSPSYIYKTTNGGNNWSAVFTQAGGFINAIALINGTLYGILGDPVGGRWQVWFSTNEGSSWDSSGIAPLWQAGSETGFNNSLCVAFNSAWFGTINSRVYYTPYQSQSWIIQPTPGLSNSYSVWFNDTIIGMTGGTIMMKTTNSGTNWNQISAPGSGNILGIAGELNSNIWCYVRGIQIYCSTDNGTNWILQYASPSGTFQHISRARYGTYHWAVRNNGGITRGTGIVTGIMPIESGIPGGFKLHQNYPNPFNPSTSIKFEVPKATHVGLVIYDELGREIAILVNEKLAPGTYEADWDASNFSSGTYFYKLMAGDYAETKKMILIK